ncbi:MAG: hypothetical protein A7316_07050 [Candidatus Altiarchaeales archaeon WOR_SM1_86-2]|nr:MAG: hypothetical protein A7315_05460 [Candidatus Altiarchaeales archaeon WOR_SM1_79]ODS38794.1 MAG: hypothetical protein A7316_07050 [Candidatus Altiarchaeales archaeon WOR_SM1_86-2]
MKGLGYYPGCSLEGSSQEYGKSTEKLYEALGFTLHEIENWVCCGATPGHSSSHLLSDALALKNLSTARKQGIERLIAPCMACYSRFKFAQHNVKDKRIRKKLEEIIEEKYDCENEIEVIHPLDNLNETEILDKIKKNIKKVPKNLKTVCYYGCVFTRPPEVMGVSDYENPDQMERLLNTVGVEVMDWHYKTKCCGASLSISNTEISLDLCKDILYDAKSRGADMIVVACPLCQVNLDLRQGQIEKRHNLKFGMPVLYITQVIGLAIGLSVEDLGIDKHFVNPLELLRNKGII